MCVYIRDCIVMVIMVWSVWLFFFVGVDVWVHFSAYSECVEARKV